MSLLESVIYGLFSGVAEFLPVSARAHQALMRYLLGVDTRDSIQDLLVHMGILLALFVSGRELFAKLRHEKKMASRRKKGRRYESKGLYDLRLVKTAAVPLVLGLIVYFATYAWERYLLILAGFLVLNGAILLFAEHMRHGNRDARTMTGLDSITMGIAGAASVLPGISRTGMVISYGTARGADVDNSANWAVMLSVPALIFAMVFDLSGVISQSGAAVSMPMIVGYLLSGVSAFCGGYVGVYLLRVLLNRSGISGFAYYSMGAALFSFVLYLIT